MPHPTPKRGGPRRRHEPPRDSVVFVSFFTPAFAPDAAQLAQTLRVADCSFCLQPAPETAGGYAAARRRMPVFVRDMMLRYEPRPVVWIDADARVRRAPDLLKRELPSRGVDFAAALDAAGNPLTNLLYFANSPAAWRLVRRWEQILSDDPAIDPRPALAQALAAVPRDSLDAARLPPPYLRRAGARGLSVVEHERTARMFLPEPV